MSSFFGSQSALTSKTIWGDEEVRLREPSDLTRSPGQESEAGVVVQVLSQGQV